MYKQVSVPYTMSEVSSNVAVSTKCAQYPKMDDSQSCSCQMDPRMDIVEMHENSWSFPPFSILFHWFSCPCYDWTVPVLARIDVVLVRVLLVLLRGVAVVAIDIDVPCFSSSGLNGLESLWVEEEQPMALPVFSHNVIQRLRGRGAVFWLCEKTATAKKSGFPSVELLDLWNLVLWLVVVACSITSFWIGKIP